MIKLSEEYKNNIISMFSNIGEEWLKKVPDIINKYINQFELTDVKLLNELTYNVLLFANSEDFGEIVLKVEIPFKELTIRESEALKLDDGKCSCKCYYSNIDDGVLILEKLNPGYSLDAVESLEERIKVFSSVAKKFNQKVCDVNVLPKYSDIFNRSFDMAIQNDFKFALVNSSLVIAKALYQELEDSYESNYLLHSDMFSSNILKDHNEWKVIDPHGFIGNKLLDSSIFIQKEVEKLGFNENNLEHILELMGKYCAVNKSDLCKALYVNYVLNICWGIEINEDINKINEKIENSKLILKCYNNYKSNYRKVKLKTK